MDKLRDGIMQYSNNLDALREFVEVLDPFLQERRLSQTNQLEHFIAELSELRNRIGMTDDGKTNRDIGTEIDSLRALLPKGVSAITASYHSHIHWKLLYHVSLITLVSTAEWLCCELLHVYFELYPDALAIDEKSIKYRDLRDFDSVEDARKYLIDREVELIVRGSIEGCLKRLKRRFRLSMDYLNQDGLQEQLGEAYQRRNLLVHSGGVITTQYVKLVGEQLRAGGLGETVEVPKEYLLERVNLFEKAFVLIGVELWKKLSPSDMRRFEVLSDITYRHLIAERWDVAKCLAYFSKNDAQLAEVSRLTARFNYWQCQKWLGKFCEVEAAVKAEDLSAKEPRFRLGKLALLDNEDDFVRLAKELIEKQDLTMDDLRTWPIFREMRKTEAYKKAFP